ncbi:MAG: alpha-L-arabinofuranosidase [Planctomycetaceae bacterium]|nr:alpha-L-arabinofuranosidase [Planctomycetaceae bacterium]
MAAGCCAAAAEPLRADLVKSQAAIKVDIAPRYELSPHLFMQFMEPLGVTDGSVEAAWDHRRQAWREDVVDVTRQLAPGMMRWGGIFTDFYRWREGVGPRDQRVPMLNLMWGGVETNQVGTAEFHDFCQQVGADPLMCVNFQGDGREQYRRANGRERWGDVREAADWVAYCNDPHNEERRRDGYEQPLTIRHWQLGNETSYDRAGFDRETAIAKTVEFAKAMRAVDPEIRIIAWGDSGWGPAMHDRAGELVDMLAFHHMFNPDRPDEPVLAGERYRRDPAATWDCLMDAWQHNDRKIREVRASLDGRAAPLAMTECHFAIPGRDRCDVLSTWAAGVSYGRILNNHQRHGDVLKIATAADFCGTRWQVNAVMIPVPQGRAYLMPVARVMQLYRAHLGERAVDVAAAGDLDVVGSRTGDTVFLHVVNTSRTAAVPAELELSTGKVKCARRFSIVEQPEVEVSQLNDNAVMQVAEVELPADKAWEFPAASVSAVEVEIAV